VTFTTYLPGVRCSQGHPHPLLAPACKLMPTDANLMFVGAARCARCKRTFLTPRVSVPARLMLSISGPAAIQKHLMQWACAWLAHEAARMN